LLHWPAMAANPLIVTLDGPAGTGKSSVAVRLADRLGVDYLDTGAMYRAVAAWAVDEGIDTAAVAERVGELTIDVDASVDPVRVSVDGRDVSGRIREDDVTAAVSEVAQLPEVREALVAAQQRIGQTGRGLVTEGRDQGTVVFPNATIKFYLDADAEERARRRVGQLAESGREADVEEVKQQIEARDERDRSRDVGPLKCPTDAVVIDTSELTLEEVVGRLETLVRRCWSGEAS
ncbi:MAG: (d)CMP kinase, partial [Phycisphaeraceae bacterium]|nr:(d)CMP kinase [Phycisphaeraceae bacterium]